MPGAPQSKTQRSINNLKAKVRVAAPSKKAPAKKRSGLREIARKYRGGMPGDNGY